MFGVAVVILEVVVVELGAFVVVIGEVVVCGEIVDVVDETVLVLVLVVVDAQLDAAAQDSGEPLCS